LSTIVMEGRWSVLSRWSYFNWILKDQACMFVCDAARSYKTSVQADTW